jgi:hypothetical protein
VPGPQVQSSGGAGTSKETLPIGFQTVGFEERDCTIPAQERVLGADGLPDQQAVKGIAVVWSVGKPVKGCENFGRQRFFGQA